MLLEIGGDGTMATFEVFFTEYRESPKRKYVTRTLEEAFEAYRKDWTEGNIPGDMILKYDWHSLRLWAVHEKK